jgi:Pectate lyase superfamily protein/Right handed beta helix region
MPTIPASDVEFLRADTGAVIRTAEEKFSDLVCVKDFGAAGDGVTNDTASINDCIAAVAAGQTIHFPAGDYLVGDPMSSVPLSPIPIQVNVLMEGGAWLKGNGEDVTNFLFPLGDNILQVNIDGASLPAEGGVKGAWPEGGSAVGISGYVGTGGNSNVENVVVVNSRIKNLQYAVLTEGAKRWLIHGCYFRDCRNSGVQMGAKEERECLHNVVSACSFDNLGDYAVTFYSTDQENPGTIAYNNVIGNTARNCQQRVNGYAFGCEAGNPDFQHHFLIANNSYECTSAGLLEGNGGITISTTADSVVTGNVLCGFRESTGQDKGINAIGVGEEPARNGLIANNLVEDFQAGGIVVDGHDNCTISGNVVKNCGGVSANFPAIQIALLRSTRGVTVVGNTLLVTSDYGIYGAGAAAIGASVASGEAVSDITIRGNTLTNPNDYGIYLAGHSGYVMTNVNVVENVINGTQDETFFQRNPVIAGFVDGLTIRGNTVVDALRGFQITDCDTGTISENDFRGSETIATLFDLTGTTGFKVRNNDVTAPVGDPVTPDASVTNPANNNVCEGNTVLVTESHGSANGLSSGGTVSHGLTFAPTNVVLTRTSSSGADIYVSAKAATTFTVTFTGGGTVDFDWRAEL